MKGDKDKAMEFFEQSVKTDVFNFIEYQGAVAELERLKSR